MKIFLVIILGLMILIGAIILNFIASYLGLISWFDFLKNPQKATILNYIWLFFLYPCGLGLIAYYASKLLNLN